MATTNIDRLRTVGPRKRQHGNPCCFGPDAEHITHIKGCTKWRPKCRWNRLKKHGPPCVCVSVGFPHRAGSYDRCERRGAASVGDAIYGPPRLDAPAPGAQTAAGTRMGEAQWWRARVAVSNLVEEAVRAGSSVLTPEAVTFARAVLTGEATAANVTVVLGRGRKLLLANHAWYEARRAVTDVVLPYLARGDGVVLPPDVAETFCGSSTAWWRCRSSRTRAGSTRASSPRPPRTPSSRRRPRPLRRRSDGSDSASRRWLPALIEDAR
jgi:hypothetical protein